MFIRKIILSIFCSFLIFNYAKADEAIFYDTNGKAVQLSHLKGKWVVINYWAGWCSACREEVPELNQFYNKIDQTNIVFYGVDYDDLSFTQLKSAIDSMGIQYPVLTSDPGSIWHLEDADAIPTTFIINPQGQVVKTITGTTSADELLDAISALQR